MRAAGREPRACVSLEGNLSMCLKEDESARNHLRWLSSERPSAQPRGQRRQGARGWVQVGACVVNGGWRWGAGAGRRPTHGLAPRGRQLCPEFPSCDRGLSPHSALYHPPPRPPGFLLNRFPAMSPSPSPDHCLPPALPVSTSPQPRMAQLESPPGSPRPPASAHAPQPSSPVISAPARTHSMLRAVPQHLPHTHPGLSLARWISVHSLIPPSCHLFQEAFLDLLSQADSGMPPSFPHPPLLLLLPSVYQPLEDRAGSHLFWGPRLPA